MKVSTISDLNRLQTLRNGSEESNNFTLYDPRPVPQKLELIGLGTSIAGNVKAEVIVVRNFSELDAMKDQVKGKIVCYNAAWTGYG